MLTTIALAYVAGFFGGNGLPYYVAGGHGEGTNPGPFSDTPAVNVLMGCAGLGVAGLCWWLADTPSHALAGWLAALAGIATVGLIHARLWNADPWGTSR